MKDVARKAGVSLGTVSNYINGTHPVSAEKKLRIENAMSELRFVPNASARALKSGQTNMVNIILPNLSDPYYIHILQGAENALRKQELDVHISVTHENPELERSILENFQSNQGAGTIIVSCQPDAEGLTTRVNMPMVHIDRNCSQNSSFLSCNYREVTYQATVECLRKQEAVAILAGPEGHFSEDEAVAGYLEAHRDLDHPVLQGRIIRCEMLEESAFFSFLEVNKTHSVNTVIATSQNAVNGISQGIHLLGGALAHPVQIIGFGISTWNEKNNNEGICYIKRPAIMIGRRAAQMLCQLIKGAATETHIVKLDWEHKNSQREKKSYILDGARELRIAFPDFPQMRMFASMIPQFENMYNCHVTLQYIPLKIYLEKILQNRPLADVCMIDRPWMYTLVENGVLSDISKSIQEEKLLKGKFLVNSLDSMCRYKGAYYGMPFTCMPQIMYYRKDLFSDPSICRRFERKHKMKLRPPRTWEEYLLVAEFFTRTENNDSPTEYGSSFAAAYSSCFSSEFYTRLWERKGKLYDKEFNVQLASRECLEVYEMLLEMTRYCPGDYLHKDNSGAMNDFLSGRTAMIITFRSPQRESTLLKEQIGANRIGFAQVPGKRAILGGWSLAVSAESEEKEMAFRFIDWACGDEIASYVAILTGQSVLRSVYDNAELMMKCPWMPVLKLATEAADPIIPPNSFLLKTIPQERIAQILYTCFLDISQRKKSIEVAVWEAQEQMKILFARMGYKQLD